MFFLSKRFLCLEANFMNRTLRNDSLIIEIGTSVRFFDWPRITEFANASILLEKKGNIA